MIGVRELTYSCTQRDTDSVLYSALDRIAMLLAMAAHPHVSVLPKPKIILPAFLRHTLIDTVKPAFGLDLIPLVSERFEGPSFEVRSPSTPVVDAGFRMAC